MFLNFLKQLWECVKTMINKEDLNINFISIYKKTATKAGQRYMPFLSPEMPNIKLDYIKYLNAVSLNQSFLTVLKETVKHIEYYNYNTNTNEPKQTTNFIDPLIKHLYISLNELSIDVKDLTNLMELKSYINKVTKITISRRNTHLNIRSKRELTNSEKDKYSRIQSEYYKLYTNLFTIQNEFDYFIDAFENKPYILITGEAGIGKTHFLVDSTKTIIEDSNQAIVFLGEIFKNNTSILESIKAEIKCDYSDEIFLKKLNKQALESNKRFLIILDAINEIDISSDTIKSKINYFMNKVKKFKYISVVLSCRTPYQHNIISELQDFFVFNLPGLPQEEALKQFSIYFDVQPIELPFIMHELSNPLFLKTTFETITLAKNRDKSIQVSSLLSKGNESLKEIFEKYIFEHSINIFKHKRHRLILWNNIIKPLCKFNFESLSNDKSFELSEKDVLKIISDSIDNSILEESSIKSSEDLLTILVNIGIFRRDIDYRTGQQIIKVTYQKLYDYLMVRYIFEIMPNINKNSKKEVSSEYEKLLTEFRFFSFVEALIVEFPTRNKNEELFDFLTIDFLKKNGRYLLQRFTNGLLWRRNRSFTDRTKFFINKSLQYDFDNTLEVLFIISTKPSHPYCKKLFEMLYSFSLAKRDLILGRFLKYRIDSENPIGLYTDWLYTHDKTKINEQYAENIFNYLQWFLSLPIPDYRDKITNIIVNLATVFPKVFFSHIQNNIDINDEYIKERLITALYGIIMRHKNESSWFVFIKDVSLWLYEKIYINFNTYNIVVLDTVKAIIESAFTINPSLELDKNIVYNFKLKEQYNFWKLPNYSKCKDFLKSQSFSLEPMRMDFTNYTIGNRFKNRANYTHSHDYDKAVLYINNRVFELGWNKKNFQDLDREYSDFYGGRMRNTKIERYGKKYSWIAYNEYMGYLTSEAYFNPRKDYYDEDDSFDRFWEKTIDPTFPNIPQFFIDKPFVEKPTIGNIKESIVGDEWIMIFCFIRIRNNDESKEYFLEASFNSDIDAHNRLNTVYSTFFGELFWSETIPESDSTDLCLEYSSGDYNTEFSTEYNFVGITKEVATELKIKVDLLNSKFTDEGDTEAMKIYKFKNDTVTQNITLLRKDLLSKYMNIHKYDFYISLGQNDNINQSNDCNEKFEIKI